MTSSQNWIHNIDNKPEPSLNDKLASLLKIGHKLVLVQLHELERIKKLRHKEIQSGYVIHLYNHYIVQQLPKTYLT